MLADHTDGSDSHRAVPPGYPHVDAVLRAVELSRRPGASFSRSLGWPLPPHRDQLVHWLLDTGATDALLREGDVVPPPMCSIDWKPMCRGRQPGSGGGSNTLNCMFRFPDVFSVGVSVAPVLDQRLYDTMHFHSLIARYFLDHLSPGARDVP